MIHKAIKLARLGLLVLLTIAAVGIATAVVVSGGHHGMLLWDTELGATWGEGPPFWLYTSSRGGIGNLRFWLEHQRVLDTPQPDSHKEWSCCYPSGPYSAQVYWGTSVFTWRSVCCRQTMFTLDLRALSLLFAAYPVIAFIRGPLRRWRRRRKGLCLKCGYDLTGNVTGTCPECGTESVGRASPVEGDDRSG